LWTALKKRWVNHPPAIQKWVKCFSCISFLHCLFNIIDFFTMIKFMVKNWFPLPTFSPYNAVMYLTPMLYEPTQ
jgi:hypothetical protein